MDTKIILLLNVVNIWKSKDFLDLTRMVLITSHDKMYIYVTNLINSQVEGHKSQLRSWLILKYFLTTFGSQDFHSSNHPLFDSNLITWCKISKIHEL
jgi:hypothetical protein